MRAIVGRGHASYRTGGDGISATCRHGASHVDAHRLVKGVPHVQHVHYDAAARNECPQAFDERFPTDADRRSALMDGGSRAAS
jgi:hypothetical protein